MMSNASRRRRRVQRRNLALVVLFVAVIVAMGGYMLSGGDTSTGDPLATPPQTSRSSNPLGPATADAAQTRDKPTQNSATLPDPQPVLRGAPDTATSTTRIEQAPEEPAADTDIAVIEMGVPVVADTTKVQPDRPARETTPSNAPALPVSTSAGVSDLIARADALVAQSKPVQARDILNRALFARTTTEAERETLRGRISTINDTLVFSRAVAPSDPVVESYTIGPGDSLAKIAARENLKTDWRLISQINGISDPRRIRVGQSLKLVKGPFHGVVYKSRYRLDLFASATDTAGNRLYIRSFPVGLGEFGSTPEGSFVVRTHSKLVNPVWTNPRTGEYFGADNPANPIGEHWIGLDPADDASAEYTQYGLHGTIDPASIGQSRSMGCVRLAAPDIELVYGLLVEKDSTVEILP